MRWHILSKKKNDSILELLPVMMMSVIHKL